MMYEGLEARRLMSVTATLTHAGTLIVQGTSTADTIYVNKYQERISWSDGKDMVLQGDSLITIDPGPHEGSFDVAQVKRVRIEGAGGNDYIRVDDNLQRPCTVVGGAGNDTITGGNFAETLSGGAGDDLIVSKEEHLNRKTAAIDAHIRSGRDFDALGIFDRAAILVGGAGDDTITPAANDQINGGEGNDTIKTALYTKDNTITVTKGSAESIFAASATLIEHYALPERIFFY